MSAILRPPLLQAGICAAHVASGDDRATCLDGLEGPRHLCPRAGYRSWKQQ